MGLGAYIEEVQLVGLDADAVGEQKDVAFLPGDLLGGKFMASSGGRHTEGRYANITEKCKRECKDKREMRRMKRRRS